MPVVTIHGIEIDFPYEPYKCQLAYMSRVIETLDGHADKSNNTGGQGSHAILESPTGTGKTLCLLCASLAWLLQMRKREQRLLAQQALLSQHDDGPAGAQSLSASNKTRIFYASRTHGQLAQVVKELNKTVYASLVKVVVMGSRDQLCLNPTVKEETNSALKNHICRHQVKSRKCKFYRGYEKMDTEFVSAKAEDIEDLLRYGSKNEVCPYFRTRYLAESADLILLPYNYILEQSVRSANKIDVRDSVVIFDEAHNLVQMCEDSCSVTLRSQDLAGCVKEATGALRLLLQDEEQLRNEMDNSETAFGKSNAAGDNKLKDAVSEQDLGFLIDSLSRLEHEMCAIDVSPGVEPAGVANTANEQGARRVGKLPGLVYTPEYLLQLLARCDLNPATIQAVVSVIDRTASFLTHKNVDTSGLFNIKGTALIKYSRFLSTVFFSTSSSNFEGGGRGGKNLSAGLGHVMKTSQPVAASEDTGDPSHFMVYVKETEGRQFRNDAVTGLQSEAQKAGRELSYQCFHAGLGMRFMLREKDRARNIVVTSGTLTPLTTTKRDLAIPFAAELTNSHVIKPDQVWFGVVCKGPAGVRLDGSYGNRTDAKYLTAMGQLLVNLSRIVPEGMLVFFASYAHMKGCIKSWTEDHTWNSIGQRKPIFVEPQERGDLPGVMAAYTAAVEQNDKGAILMGVCRGKISEGIDFTDRQARAVVVCGIPYPPITDVRVALKQLYLADCHNKSIPLIRPDQWYKLEAVRSVNQAIGRVIRHVNDHGAIILADYRFTQWTPDCFPHWMRDNYRKYDVIYKALPPLVNFYKRHSDKLKARAIVAARAANATAGAASAMEWNHSSIGVNRSAQCGAGGCGPEPLNRDPCVSRTFEDLKTHVNALVQQQASSSCQTACNSGSGGTVAACKKRRTDGVDVLQALEQECDSSVQLMDSHSAQPAHVNGQSAAAPSQSTEPKAATASAAHSSRRKIKLASRPPVSASATASAASVSASASSSASKPANAHEKALHLHLTIRPHLSKSEQAALGRALQQYSTQLRFDAFEQLARPLAESSTSFKRVLIQYEECWSSIQYCCCTKQTDGGLVAVFKTFVILTADRQRFHQFVSSLAQ